MPITPTYRITHPPESGQKQKHMKVSELRVNNWVLYGINKSPIKISVDDLCDMQCSIDNEGDYEPTPLTDEWLEKLGGLKDEYEDVFIEVDSESDTRLYLSMKGYIQLVESYHCPMFDYEHIRHVHQLQNLFFALTGRELTIREDAK